MSNMPESVQGWSWQKCRVKVATSTSAGGDTYNGAAYDAPQGSIKNGGIDGSAQWQDCPGCPKCEKQDGLVLRRGNGRPTRSWERLLVFAKGVPYYYDTIGVREEAIHAGRVVKASGATAKNAGSINATAVGFTNHDTVVGDGRNLRDWQFWPTKGAALTEQHFAAYPPDLPALAIKAGTSERCCSRCGAPYARVVASRFIPSQATNGRDGKWGSNGDADARSATDGRQARGTNDTATLGWRPTCPCPADTPWQPATVLDPFFGSGSTGIAADRLGRDCVGIDLNAEYTSLAVRRVTQDAPLLTWGQVTLDTLEAEAAGG